MVVAIIGLLASIVLVGVGAARAKARDVTRKSNLDVLRKAIIMWQLDNNNNMEFPTGCGGYGGGGTGHIDYQGTNYPKSIIECLKDAGYINQDIIDPKRHLLTDYPGDAPEVFSYMKYSCTDTNDIRLYAHLETGNSNALNGIPCTAGVAGYGMNYMLSIPKI